MAGTALHRVKWKIFREMRTNGMLEDSGFRLVAGNAGSDSELHQVPPIGPSGARIQPLISAKIQNRPGDNFRLVEEWISVRDQLLPAGLRIFPALVADKTIDEAISRQVNHFRVAASVPILDQHEHVDREISGPRMVEECPQ